MNFRLTWSSRDSIICKVCSISIKNKQKFKIPFKICSMDKNRNNKSKTFVAMTKTINLYQDVMVLVWQRISCCSVLFLASAVSLARLAHTEIQKWPAGDQLYGHRGSERYWIKYSAEKWCFSLINSIVTSLKSPEREADSV